MDENKYYDYQRIYEELKDKILDLSNYTENISLSRLYKFMSKLEEKYEYSDLDLPF